MEREARKADIHALAQEIFVALIANPERYKYIADCILQNEISQEEATQKNISKAYKLATAFINEKAKYI